MTEFAIECRVIERSIEHDADFFLIGGGNKILPSRHRSSTIGGVEHIGRIEWITAEIFAKKWIHLEEILHRIRTTWIVKSRARTIAIDGLATIESTGMNRLKPQPIGAERVEVIEIPAVVVCMRRARSIVHVLDR